jgi:hypothetical protein
MADPKTDARRAFDARAYWASLTDDERLELVLAINDPEQLKGHPARVLIDLLCGVRDLYVFLFVLGWGRGAVASVRPLPPCPSAACRC